MLTGSLFNTSKTPTNPNKSMNSSNLNLQSVGNSFYKKPSTNPASRGDPNNYGSNSTSRGMSFMAGSEVNADDMDKYDNYMINVMNLNLILFLLFTF